MSLSGGEWYNGYPGFISMGSPVILIPNYDGSMAGSRKGW